MINNISYQGLKCLLVTPHYFPMYGGALTVYDALAREAGGGIEVLTASTNYLDGTTVDGWQQFDANTPYTIHRVPKLRPVLMEKSSANVLTSAFRVANDWLLKRKVLQQVMNKLAETQADVLCIGSLESLGWLVKALGKKRTVKTIIYVHGEEVSQQAYSKRAEERRREALLAADKIVAVSSFTANLVHSKYGVDSGRISLISNGVDLDKFDGAVNSKFIEKLQLPDTYVFSFGRLVERKGFDKLLEAWPAVLAGLPDAKLVIGGEGPLESHLKIQIEKLGLSKSVTMLGWVQSEALSSIYGSSSLFVMPNRTLEDGDTEGFGLVLLEAAAMGVACIGGRAGGAVDAVIENETGLLVNGDDVSDIASTIVRILKDEELRTKLACGAKLHAQANGWKQKTQELMTVFETL